MLLWQYFEEVFLLVLVHCWLYDSTFVQMSIILNVMIILL